VKRRRNRGHGSIQNRGVERFHEEGDRNQPWQRCFPVVLGSIRVPHSRQSAGHRGIMPEKQPTISIHDTERGAAALRTGNEQYCFPLGAGRNALPGANARATISAAPQFSVLLCGWTVLGSTLLDFRPWR
jgi:hypothetical protein